MDHSTLSNRRILLGISGGIAAYKSAEIVRLFKKAGASVRVVMTHGAQEFITPMTLQALSGNPVHTELLDAEAEAAMGHIELARWADAIVIAPATANIIAEIAAGKANDLLTTLILASEAKLIVAPAMNTKMWLNKNTLRNVAQLKTNNAIIVDPGNGEQACGEFGPGRMEDPERIVLACSEQFCSRALSGTHVVITAGPTREAIDPVRYISNHSSGKMGYALARAASDAGAKVTLISGPVQLQRPDRIQTIDVISAQEMHEASMNAAQSCDIFIGCAAVADYRPEYYAPEKIKKDQKDKVMDLRLVKNPDILKSIAQLSEKPFLVGFAAESEQLKNHALEKLNHKNLDMIAANDISQHDIGFNSEQNALNVFYQKKKQQEVTEMVFQQSSKTLIAEKLINLIAQQFSQ